MQGETMPQNKTTTNKNLDENIEISLHVLTGGGGGIVIIVVGCSTSYL
jgi:hypothetical protein